jgi:hypothetical protein
MKISLLLALTPGKNGLKKEMDFQGAILPNIGDQIFFGPDSWAHAKVEVRFYDLGKDEWTLTLSSQDPKLFHQLGAQSDWKKYTL